MKIGILTYHRAYNYGAVLQCYALQEVLKHMGHDVYIIDYRQPEIEAFYKFKSCYSREKWQNKKIPASVKYIVSCIIKDLRNYIFHYRFKTLFESFQKHFFSLTQKTTTSIPCGFDRYFIGSDMLWAYDVATSKFDPFFLGEFIHNKESKIVGYAISGTPDSFHRLGEERHFEFIKNFDYLSVREKALSDIIKEYTGKIISCCIDPTLLTTKELWSNITYQNRRGRKYIVTYYLRVPGESRKGLNGKIRELAKDNNLDIINIDASGSTCPRSVRDFVTLIKDAQYVVTDSFHGVVFSLIFERPFHALRLRDSHDARYVDILKTINAEDLAVDIDYNPFFPCIDYTSLNENIALFRENSISFIRNSLS